MRVTINPDYNSFPRAFWVERVGIALTLEDLLPKVPRPLEPQALVKSILISSMAPSFLTPRLVEYKMSYKIVLDTPDGEKSVTLYFVVRGEAVDWHIYPEDHNLITYGEQFNSMTREEFLTNPTKHLSLLVEAVKDRLTGLSLGHADKGRTYASLIAYISVDPERTERIRTQVTE